MNDAENKALLECVNAEGKIYMIGSEFHGDDEEHEDVANGMDEQVPAPPQCGIEWTRLPLEMPPGSAHVRREWSFYMRFAVCHENACDADADFAFRAILDALESGPRCPNGDSTPAPTAVPAATANANGTRHHLAQRGTESKNGPNTL